MDITQQQYIIALAETGSITAAARYLNVSQPAISTWLKNIENQLGVTLAIRSKKRIILTPAGHIYLDGAKKMVDIQRDTYRTISQLLDASKETIVITGTPSGGASLFSNLYKVFKSRHPAVSLQFVESYNRRSFQMIREGTADLALCSSLDPENDLYEYIHTHDQELILLVPYGFPMAYDARQLEKNAEFPEIRLSDLKDVPFIMPSPDMSYYTRLQQIFRETGYQPHSIFQSASTKLIYDMICNGNGVGIVSRRWFSPLDRVSPYSFRPKLISHSVIVYRKGRTLTPAQQTVVDYLVALQRK